MLSSDNFQGFLYQIFVVSPVISWILSPGRYSKQRGLVYAIGFLVALAAITIGLQISEKEPNYYELLGVPRASSLADVKKQFRVRSIDLHPDKNPSPSATEEFNALRDAFDVIGDADKRALYDLFGPNAATKDKNVLMVETFIGMLSFYVVWGVVIYGLCMGDNARDARSWCYLGAVILFVLELNLCFAGLQIPPTWFPYITVFEFVKFARAVYPMFMNGSRIIGGYLYVDLAKENVMLGIELLKSNRTILLAMRQLQGQLASVRRTGNSTKDLKTESIPLTAPAHRDKRSKQVNVLQEASYYEDDTFDKLSQQEKELFVPQPKVQAPPSVRIPSFVYALGFYFVVTYFFK